MNATDVIAYAADADYYCEDCAAETYGPDYSCETCGQTWAGFTPDPHYAHSATSASCVGSKEPTDREDSEGNQVHPVFGSDEWWEPSEDGRQVLACSRCGVELDEIEGDKS